METEQEILEPYDLGYSGGQPFPATPPPSPTAAARREEVEEEHKRFLELLELRSPTKCRRCKELDAVVAVVHKKEEEKPCMSIYHFLYCKKCARDIIWRLAFCPLCKEKFQATKNRY